MYGNSPQITVYPWAAEKTKRYTGKIYMLNGRFDFHCGEGTSKKMKK